MKKKTKTNKPTSFRKSPAFQSTPPLLIPGYKKAAFSDEVRFSSYQLSNNPYSHTLNQTLLYTSSFISKGNILKISAGIDTPVALGALAERPRFRCLGQLWPLCHPQEPSLAIHAMDSSAAAAPSEPQTKRSMADLDVQLLQKMAAPSDKSIYPPQPVSIHRNVRLFLSLFMRYPQLVTRSNYSRNRLSILCRPTRTLAFPRVLSPSLGP